MPIWQRKKQAAIWSSYFSILTWILFLTLPKYSYFLPKFMALNGTQNFALEKLSFLPRLCSRKWFFFKQRRFIVHRSSHTKNPKYNLLNCFCLAFNAQWQYFKVTLFIAPYKYHCQQYNFANLKKFRFTPHTKLRSYCRDRILSASTTYNMCSGNIELPGVYCSGVVVEFQ